MAAIAAALVTLVCSLFLGQAALRLAGAREWSWLSPAVGIAVGMVISSAAIHAPGRCVTLAIVLGLLTAAAAAWCLRSPAHRPPLADLLAAAPVAALTLVPFLAAGHFGILGVSVDNDMAAHLLFLEGIASPAAAAAAPLPVDYPLGPHAMAAVITKALGIESQDAFTGWTIAMPIINAWIALAVARRAHWPAKATIATVVGLPFLIAGFYGQGSFKEVCQAGLVLATVLLLAGYGPKLGGGRWAVLALLVAGMISVYSVTGLPWPLLFLGIWIFGLAAIRVRRDGWRQALAAGRSQLPAIAAGVAVLVVVLIPQAHRIYEFAFGRSGVTGISSSELGNLVGPLPGWESFGIWGNQDYRLPNTDAFGGIPWVPVVVVLVLIGAVYALRRGRWMLPAAAAGAMLIWAVSTGSQSPYVSAKGLVIASPLLILLAALPLSEPHRRRSPIWWAAPVIAVLLLSTIIASDLRALRFSPVQDVAQAHELESFQPFVQGKSVLFIGQDDFISWELAGGEVKPVIFGATPAQTLRPRKHWEFGQPVDFDSVHAGLLNEFEWVVSSNDPAASDPPPQLQLVGRTRDYDLWRRVGHVRERAILAEGEMPGKTLDCGTPEGRRLEGSGGLAAVRGKPITFPGPSIPAGGGAIVSLPLPPGKWRLSAPYISPQPIEVTAPGLHQELAPNLERPAQRRQLGEVDGSGTEETALTLEVGETFLSPASAAAYFGEITATPVGAEHLLPLSRACGRYVDWYFPKLGR